MLLSLDKNHKKYPLEIHDLSENHPQLYFMFHLIPIVLWEKFCFMIKVVWKTLVGFQIQFSFLIPNFTYFYYNALNIFYSFLVLFHFEL